MFFMLSIIKCSSKKQNFFLRYLSLCTLRSFLFVAPFVFTYSCSLTYGMEAQTFIIDIDIFCFLVFLSWCFLILRRIYVWITAFIWGNYDFILASVRGEKYLQYVVNFVLQVLCKHGFFYFQIKIPS